MERESGKEIPAGKSRVAFLMDNCDAVEEKSYMKQYSPDELVKLKEQLSDISIEINDIETEKKNVIAEFKDRLKPLTEELKSILDGLKKKAELVTEKCYKFTDREARETAYYNENGDLIESRPAFGEELQGNIFQLERTGTNN